MDARGAFPDLACLLLSLFSSLTPASSSFERSLLWKSQFSRSHNWMWSVVKKIGKSKGFLNVQESKTNAYKLRALLVVHTRVALGDLTGYSLFWMFNGCTVQWTLLTTHSASYCCLTHRGSDLRPVCHRFLQWHSLCIMHTGFLILKKHSGLIMEKKDLIFFYSHSVAYKYQVSKSLECIC